MAYQFEKIATRENDVVIAEVFTIDGGKPRVRVIDADSGEVLPNIPVFETVEKAVAYAERCTRY